MAGDTAARRSAVFHRGRRVGWRTDYDDRLAYAVLRALDKRDALWARDAIDARLLLDAATELLNRWGNRDAEADDVVAATTGSGDQAGRTRFGTGV